MRQSLFRHLPSQSHSHPYTHTSYYVTFFAINMSDLEEELLGLAEDDPRARKRKNGGGRKAKSSA